MRTAHRQFAEVYAKKLVQKGWAPDCAWGQSELLQQRYMKKPAAVDAAINEACGSSGVVEPEAPEKIRIGNRPADRARDRFFFR